ncbi:MAG: hypothetical protein APR53_01960 [Methanoculleus sp. SDB]|nr:MAG: hypothetical protein APR53_01960 [Methanoculleus sp. SDB]
MESIFVTDNRIIKMTPTTLGLRANITDHLYSDMANANLKKGILATDLFINMRHNPQPFMIKNIPKDGANDILKTIQMGIAGRIGGGKKSQGQSQVVVQEQVDIVDQIKKLSELKNAGILSEDEFETKKKELLAKI